MRFYKSRSSLSVFLLVSLLFIPSIHAATIDITNNCAQTVWAAAVPGGGRPLNRGETWTISWPAATTNYAWVWARTGCNFDEAGRGSCQTGDCGGVLECSSNGTGQSPSTVAEYILNESHNKHLFDISLVNGFNVPMDFSPTSGGCTQGIRCTADINGQCPNELRAPGGCNDPCTVFKTDEYCCTGAFNGPSNCRPTAYSRFFKDRCPDAYSYQFDDQSIFTCPARTNYKVVFCPTTRKELLLVCDDKEL